MSSFTSRLALAIVVAVTALSLTPAAQAATLSGVRAHVRAADHALRTVTAAAPSGSVDASLTQLRRHVRAATRGSAALYRAADTPPARLRAATALRKVAAQETRTIATLTPVIPDLATSGQIDLASFLASITVAREQVLALLTELLPALPAAAQDPLAAVIAQLSTTGVSQIGPLAGALDPASLACPALDAVGQLVATVVATLPVARDRLQDVLAMLPAESQTAVTDAFDRVPADLETLLASLRQSFSCPDSATAPAGAGPLAGVMSFVQSLVGGFLPTGGLSGTGAVAGTTPTAVPLAGILGQVTTLVPGLGGLLGGGGLLGLI